jgi:hypothetical protein
MGENVNKTGLGIALESESRMWEISFIYLLSVTGQRVKNKSVLLKLI